MLLELPQPGAHHPLTPRGHPCHHHRAPSSGNVSPPVAPSLRWLWPEMPWALALLLPLLVPLPLEGCAERCASSDQWVLSFISQGRGLGLRPALPSCSACFLEALGTCPCVGEGRGPPDSAWASSPGFPGLPAVAGIMHGLRCFQGWAVRLYVLGSRCIPGVRVGVGVIMGVS